LVQPTVDGLPGNPVLFSAVVRGGILAAEGAIGCRQWQAAHPEQVHRWITANSHYRTDVDTLQDIEALAARSGHSLQWPMDLAVAAQPKGATSMAPDPLHCHQDPST
jgi:molybdenum cofactor cytidylyltransferase